MWPWTNTDGLPDYRMNESADVEEIDFFSDLTTFWWTRYSRGVVIFGESLLSELYGMIIRVSMELRSLRNGIIMRNMIYVERVKEIN